jgi:penicillin-binding protein 1C
MLSDPGERIAGFGITDPFASGPPAAVKTGTSSRNQHIWALAASETHTVGVWLGNFAGETVIGRTGSSVPALIALEILEALRIGDKPRSIDVPAELRHISICTLSGMKATVHCPSTRREYIRGEEPRCCTFHLDGEGTDPVYPSTFASWAADHRRYGIAEGEDVAGIRFIYPREGAVYFTDNSIPSRMQAISVKVEHPRTVAPSLLVNGMPAGETGSVSLGVVTTWLVPLAQGQMVLEAAGGNTNATRRILVQ